MTIEIINNTVYDSEDVAAFVSAFFPTVTSLKIRYLNSPNWHNKFVSLIYSGYEIKGSLEVAILRYSKLPTNPLQALALAAASDSDVDYAPSIVGEHFVESAAPHFGSWRRRRSNEELVVAKEAVNGLSIRIHQKAKGAKDAAVANLARKIASRKEAILTRTHKIAQCRLEIIWYEEYIASDKATLIKEEAKLAALIAKHKKSTKKKAAV